MKKTFGLLTVLVVGGLVFMGAGCGKNGLVSSITNTVSDTVSDVADNASGKMSELDYYNLVIEHANKLSGNIDEFNSSLDTYDTFAYAREDKTCDYKKPAIFTVTQEFDEAKSVLVTSKPTMEDATKQAAVEAKFTPYFDGYQAMLDSAQTFNDYCTSEKYKDDNGEKIQVYYDDLVAKIDEVTAKQSDLFAIIKEYQNGIDLGIDENTTKPNEMVILIENELTDKTESIYQNAFTPYAQDVLDEKEADFAPVQAAYDDLIADLATQKGRGESAGISQDTMLGTSYDLYLEQVNSFGVELEKLARDQKNGEVNADNILDYDQKLSQAYQSIISSHNSIVDLLDSYTPVD
ncbi:MAG: hypothetical protein A2233_00060 [Candidatus Kerfeldbacteria bacterium RIFOXYA2_FULL_38_24]|uniref:DUF3829 domain-containing protein n=1 Tax=Candidatus Kerfeldbacteria bacterium RIFOXYB2_FULL_38_14 TaxID=1798547 RepID=A0A1G2B9T9_9BACT|nr:MAG: hypothetical protein A2233_00060 [Candidatus Kerfeldbacteria bacterium RIFOXYA2_FULL_38_24]OGY85988.1 MAG: hypothetical protein A2319_00265 [Candidatus Kerfeldbacteria bacterium RIFOXYB2_FULL_38_14]OGY90101.1 MAG: hypothetical protein A2458_03860 [Candidatus Kerfeldbacteria bacterium RIFOXYC2_FULL_38_9]